MNHLTIIGNITRDPKTRSVNSAGGPVSVCDFSVAVSDRRRKDENGQPVTTFFNCTAWRGLADVIAKFAAKGTKVCVTGPVSCRTYQANDGTTKASLEVQVEDFEFCSSRSDSKPADAQPTEQKKDDKPIAYAPVADEGLPF